MILNRSFSRRIGKSLSALQKELLEEDLPKHLFTRDNLSQFSNKAEIILEIGFGMGEHFVHQTITKPDTLFVGAEVYLNGVANVLKLAKESGHKNFLLWPNDLDLMLKDIPNDTLSGIYILFPDPWPKRRQQKKRIFNPERLNLMPDKLKAGGFIIFASDIEDYFNQALELARYDKRFSVAEQKEHDTYIQTKYHKKAIEEGRKPRFFKAVKV